MDAKTTKTKGYVTAVIGSGSKTTLIEYLARQAVAAGEKAAIVKGKKRPFPSWRRKAVFTAEALHGRRER